MNLYDNGRKGYAVTPGCNEINEYRGILFFIALKCLQFFTI